MHSESSARRVRATAEGRSVDGWLMDARLGSGSSDRTGSSLLLAVACGLRLSSVIASLGSDIQRFWNASSV